MMFYVMRHHQTPSMARLMKPPSSGRLDGSLHPSHVRHAMFGDGPEQGRVPCREVVTRDDAAAPDSWLPQLQVLETRRVN